MYEPYVDATEYAEMGYTAIPADERESVLKEASRQVDTLTFGRVLACGFDRLTDFQQGIIKEVVCEQADFMYENADAISSILNAYAINGVSMNFGTGFNVCVENGIPMQKTKYAKLMQTGLCCRLAR